MSVCLHNNSSELRAVNPQKLARNFECSLAAAHARVLSAHDMSLPWAWPTTRPATSLQGTSYDQILLYNDPK